MPRLAANLTTLFTERPFRERFAAAAACGFRAVECQFPYEMASAEIAHELAENRLEMVLFNLPPGDWAAGERGIAILPDREAEFERSVAQALTLARETGCPRLHCLAGVLPAGLSAEAARRTYVRNLCHAAEEAERQGIRVLIEPINPFDMPGYFLTSVDQAVEILSDVGSENLLLQYDLYHRARVGGDLMAPMIAHAGLVDHVQIAGCPGRNEPNDGEPNEDTLTKLDRLGYRGYVGCEYTPRGRTEDGLGWARRWLAEGSR